jgi:pimeloyl-ACP methyl ester carboxylesterase
VGTTMPEKLSLLLGLILSVLLSGIFSACDMPAMPWDKPKPDSATEKKQADEEAEETEGKEKEVMAPPKPLNEVDLLPPAMKTLPFEELYIPMADKLQLYGRLYYPTLKAKASESAGEEGSDTDGEADADVEESGEPAEETPQKQVPQYPLIVLIHGLSSDHLAWGDLPATLVKSGYSVFALDLRGHGKSTETVNHNKVTWRLFENEQWLKLYQDLDSAIQFFQAAHKKYPAVDAKNVALLGENLGANLAVFSAAERQNHVKTLLLMSPGLDYKGIIPSQAIVDIDNSVLMITGKDNEYAMHSAERLYKWIVGKKTLQIYQKVTDKPDRFSEGTALGGQLIQWLQEHLPSSGSVLPHSQNKSVEPALGNPVETGEQ